MANLYTSSAMSALNEDDYINKLYDSSRDSHKKALQEAYDRSGQELTTGQEQTRNQTEEYQQRNQVETERAAANTTPPASNTGMKAQQALIMGNRQQANASALQQQQAAVDQEYQRRRQLLADQYASQIRQAQADNDMERAQQLYEAAKAEDQQLQAYRQQAAQMLYQKGDSTVLDQMAAGEPVSRDTAGQTWDTVLRNEDAVNKIYDAQLESQREQAQREYQKAASDLEASQAAQVRQTDQALNDAYVSALKQGQYQQEIQNASGLSSGAAAMSAMGREAELSRKLTDLRKLQQGHTAAGQMEKADMVQALMGQIAQAQQNTDSSRNQALYKAAEQEEQNLLSDQELIAQLMAQKGDYSVLGKLYGLTADQVDRLQGTGRYAAAAPAAGSDIRYTINNVNPYATPEQLAAAEQLRNETLAQKLIRDERLR